MIDEALYPGKGPRSSLDGLLPAKGVSGASAPGIQSAPTLAFRPACHFASYQTLAHPRTYTAHRSEDSQAAEAGGPRKKGGAAKGGSKPQGKGGASERGGDTSVSNAANSGGSEQSAGGSISKGTSSTRGGGKTQAKTGDGKLARDENNQGFDAIDADKDGFLTRNELGASAASLSLLDTDGDDKVSRKEFEAVQYYIAPEDPEASEHQKAQILKDKSNLYSDVI